MVCLTFHLSFQETRVICILCLNYVCLCVRKRFGSVRRRPIYYYFYFPQLNANLKHPPVGNPPSELCPVEILTGADVNVPPRTQLRDSYYFLRLRVKFPVNEMNFALLQYFLYMLASASETTMIFRRVIA